MVNMSCAVATTIETSYSCLSPLGGSALEECKGQRNATHDAQRYVVPSLVAMTQVGLFKYPNTIHYLGSQTELLKMERWPIPTLNL